jgi:hypothetical protein
MDLDMTHSLCVPNMPVVTPDFELNDMHVGAILDQGMLAQATAPNKRPRDARDFRRCRGTAKALNPAPQKRPV